MSLYDETIVILGSRTDVYVARKMLAAAGWPGVKVAFPGTPLYGRRLDIDRLFVLDSWQEERLLPQHDQWAHEDLLCRYADAEAAATKIGLDCNLANR